MIQELLGGGGEVLVGGEERKISIGARAIDGSSSSSSSSSSSDNQNLRCPRCDSSNTKFCYYNNYNLTQPRHFCKTCRRYWTKGGALRNVPIGGGCRKNKSSSVPTAGKTSNVKSKPVSLEVGKSCLGNDPISNPILWATQQNSHILSLLRASQNPNPNPNPNSSVIKEEGLMIGAHMSLEPAAMTVGLNTRTVGLDPLQTQFPFALRSSFWRNNQNHHQQQQQQLVQQQHLQQQSMLLGEVPTTAGIQELYQRLRSSNNYYTDHSSAVISNGAAASSSTTAASILEPTSVTGTELGYWNPPFSWPDLPTTNGAFP